jgi:hypothetical protein
LGKAGGAPALNKAAKHLRCTAGRERGRASWNEFPADGTGIFVTGKDIVHAAN